MSSALAIASVTYVLKDLLNNGLIDQDLSGIIHGNVTVSALPPDKIDSITTTTSQLNLFMYRVTPNQGWCNVGLPSRDGRGDRQSNPPLALDLHYLMTAYGANELHSEILLGYGMQLLHETPALGRAAIRRSLTPVSDPNGSLPDDLKSLTKSELADQVEQIKIIPESLNTEELSKLWAAFQSKFRPSAAYHVSVVLIESTQAVRSPLPVLTRGRPDPDSGREEGIIVIPELVPPVPMLEKFILPNNQISSQIEDTVKLTGHHLDGSDHKVLFTNPRLQLSFQADILAGNSAGEISIKLSEAIDPDSPATPYTESWAAGFCNVALRLKRPGELGYRTTNELSFSLAPTIIMPVTIIKGAENLVTFKVKCQPIARPEQKATLLVGDREIQAQQRSATSDSLTFVSVLPADMQVTGSKHYVRLRIDGVDSILIDRSKTPPEFFVSQQLIMP